MSSIDRLKRFIDDPGDRVGKYELVREVGRGGMATVYEAYDPDLKRAVALKVLRDVRHIERLQREAAAAARLRHPNIVTVHEVGVEFIAMDFVSGKTLAEEMPGLDRRRRLEALEQIARAVGHAHGQGVVHRDLKPGNVLVEPGGRVLLTDFGLAKIEGEDLTQTGSVVGTPHYMSPEQVRGDVRAAGPASDVWALGVLLYEMVADRKPFDGATALEIYDVITRQDPPPLPGEPGAIAAKALEKDPSRRYPDATAFADELRRHLGGEAIEARPPGGASRLLKRIRKNPIPTILGVAGVIVVLTILLWRSEREVGLERLREQARLSLDAALALRRAGANDRMRRFLPPLEAAYREAPDHPEVEYLMGRMYRALLEDQKAFEHQERALEKDPDFKPALYERAVLLSKLHTLESLRAPIQPSLDLSSLARRIVRDCRKLPDMPVARGLLAYYEGRPAEARSVLEKAVREDPLLDEAWIVLARAIEAELEPGVKERDRRWEEAIASYTRALEKDRGYLPHLFGRSQVYLARADFGKLRGRDGLPDYAKAEADLDEALRIDPENAQAFFRRGRVRNQRAVFKIKNGRDPLTDCALAIDDLTGALKRVPGHRDAIIWRGNTYYHQGYYRMSRGETPLPDFEAGERDLSRVNSSDALMRRGRLRGQRAVWLAKTGQEAEAEFARADEDFAASLKANPDNPWAWTWRGSVRLDAGRLDDAESHFGEAIRSEREHAYAWAQRGVARFRRGEKTNRRKDYIDAAADFLEAVTLNPVLKSDVAQLMERAQKKAAELEQ